MATTTTRLATRPAGGRLSRRQKQRISTTVKVLIAIALLIPTLFPMYWIVISSLKTNLETHSVPVTFIPADWSLHAYHEIFDRRNFDRYLGNAMFVALATTAWGVFV